MNGEGTFVRADGFKYVGHWKNGKADGIGTSYMPEGDKAYEGEWKANNYSGKGTEYLIDGSKYVGEFKDDKKEGEGTMYLPNGQIYYKGQWKNDKPINILPSNEKPGGTSSPPIKTGA